MPVVLEPDAYFENLSLCSGDFQITPEEVEEGNLLGSQINTDDDDDNGVGIRALTTTPYQEAVNNARRMKNILLKYGVPEVSIELVPGRPSSYGTWNAMFPVSDMSHHTVSRYNPDSLTPTLSLCKRGRDDLPGPLCNGYGGYDLCYRIITFGYANHSGSGGPYTVPALNVDGFTIPKDSARRYAWGTEFEGGLSEVDWDRGLRNPRTGSRMNMREFMGRVNAGLEEALEIHPNAHLEHSTWTSRKIDRLGYSVAKALEEKRRFYSMADVSDDVWGHPVADLGQPLLGREVGEVPAFRLLQWARIDALKSVQGVQRLEAMINALSDALGEDVKAAVDQAMAEWADSVIDVNVTFDNKETPS